MLALIRVWMPLALLRIAHGKRTGTEGTLAALLQHQSSCAILALHSAGDA